MLFSNIKRITFVFLLTLQLNKRTCYVHDNVINWLLNNKSYEKVNNCISNVWLINECRGSGDN